MSYTIHNGDCIEVMKTMADNSIDSIVTDPPYELGFMGKSWDSTGIAFNVEVWQEALRVLKPGGHLLAFSGSRTYHRMAVAIEDAGFEIRDQIMWIYGSGFPKSMDISKAIDKSDATEARRQRDLKFTEWMRSIGLKARQIDDITESNMGGHYLTDKEQPAVATADMFDKLRPYLPEVPDYIEEMVKQRTIESENYKKREVIGVQKNAMQGWSMDGATQFVDRNITAPATAAAKQWQGFGTALKPAHEPLVLARKPIQGTVANNVLTFGVGGLNIDATRVGSEGGTARDGKANEPNDTGWANMRGHGIQQLNAGRFPANVIHDGSDEVVALFPDTKGATSRTRKIDRSPFSTGESDSEESFVYGDSGSAARFFYCAKASKRDRNEGLDGFEAKLPVGGANKWTEQDKRRGEGVTREPSANHHPTVKPTDLMRYLCRLITPPKGTILDPFTGSGSTGKGAIYEGFKFIGIEKDESYVEIAKARIEFAIANRDGSEA